MPGMAMENGWKERSETLVQYIRSAAKSPSYGRSSKRAKITRGIGLGAQTTSSNLERCLPALRSPAPQRRHRQAFAVSRFWTQSAQHAAARGRQTNIGVHPEPVGGGNRLQEPNAFSLPILPQPSHDGALAA